ncbi:hypothetical protein M976_02861 [Buttiauxella ferragutiae ATCC 51602]|uniref:Uncharacterized protein n=1 Tax=Buttiauxella ferragutiae ATCC 51602 TaxID=1354252 RepID=A0ABX2W704_9ENTR|nr:hypothetical protein M976_02861 [Buttiauxella ferragutiae ATCC 51602]
MQHEDLMLSQHKNILLPVSYDESQAGIRHSASARGMNFVRIN